MMPGDRSFRFVLFCLILGGVGALVGPCLREEEHQMEKRSGTLMFFTSKICVPCRQMEPYVTALRDNGVVVVEIDVDNYPTVTKNYHVDRTPTFVWVREGRVCGRLEGSTDLESLLKLVESDHAP